jgi:hypothetical protein
VLFAVSLLLLLAACENITGVRVRGGWNDRGSSSGKVDVPL